MVDRIGVRREDMYHWERRVPLVPRDLRGLADGAGLTFSVQSSSKRIFCTEVNDMDGLYGARWLVLAPLLQSLP